MRKNTDQILSACTSEQLFLLAIANPGCRSAIGRELDSRARTSRHRAGLARIGGAPAERPALMLRRAG